MTNDFVTRAQQALIEDMMEFHKQYLTTDNEAHRAKYWKEIVRCCEAIGIKNTSQFAITSTIDVIVKCGAHAPAYPCTLDTKSGKVSDTRYNIDFDLDSKCVVELQENGTIVRQFGNYRTVIMAA